MTFRKRQNYGERKKISGCQGASGERGREGRGGIEDFQVGKCTTLIQDVNNMEIVCVGEEVGLCTFCSHFLSS